MKRLYRTFDLVITRLENAVLGALMLYSAGMLCTQIFSRSVFGHAFPWAEESVRYAIIWMVFIGSSVAFREEAHISIDAVHHWLSSRWRRAMLIVVNLGSLLLAALLIRYGSELVQMMQRFGQTSSAMEVPMYWVYAVIPGSALLMAYRILQSLARLVRPTAAVPEAPSQPITTG